MWLNTVVLEVSFIVRKGFSDSVQNFVNLFSLFIVDTFWEQDLKIDKQVSFFCSFVHMVSFVEFPHSFASNFLYCFWSYHFINCQKNLSPVQKRNFNRLTEQRFLQSNLMSVHQIGSASLIPGSHAEIRRVFIRRCS